MEEILLQNNILLFRSRKNRFGMCVFCFGFFFGWLVKCDGKTEITNPFRVPSPFIGSDFEDALFVLSL